MAKTNRCKYTPQTGNISNGSLSKLLHFTANHFCSFPPAFKTKILSQLFIPAFQFVADKRNSFDAKLVDQKNPTPKLDASSKIQSNHHHSGVSQHTSKRMWCMAMDMQFSKYSTRGTCTSQWTTNDVVGSIYISLHTHGWCFKVHFTTHGQGHLCIHTHNNSFNMDLFGIGGSNQMPTANWIVNWNILSCLVHVCGFCYCVDSIFVHLQIVVEI